MELIFKEITLDLSQQTILSGVSGFCSPGEVLAIMGPTGRRLTILLNFYKYVFFRGCILLTKQKKSSCENVSSSIEFKFVLKSLVIEFETL